MKLYFLFSISLLFSLSLSAQVENNQIKIVKNFFEAFNDHDVERMSDYLADDVEWFSIESSMMMIEASGKTDVKNAMNEYFASVESVSSEAEDFIVSGSFVSIREAVSWKSETGMSTQASIGVYEISDGKIRRVWYFPSEKINN